MPERTRYRQFRVPIDRGLNTNSFGAHLEDGQFTVLKNFAYGMGKDDDWLETRQGTHCITELGGRVTSMISAYPYEGILFTMNNKIYTCGIGLMLSKTDITGNHSFENDSYWQWVNFNGLLVGAGNAQVSQTASNVLAVWNGTGDVVTYEPDTGTSSPFGAKYIAVWNNRLFTMTNSYGGPTVVNTLYYSPLGVLGSPLTPIGGGPTFEDYLAEGWGEITLTGPALTQCMGLAVLAGRLIIFTRTGAFYVDPGDPNTDDSKWNVVPLPQVPGCCSGYTIAKYDNFLIYLGEGGIYALSPSGATAEGLFRAELLSANIYGLTSVGFNGDNDEYAGIVDRHRYYISCESRNTHTQGRNDQCYVLDLLNNRWTEFDGVYRCASFAMIDGLGSGIGTGTNAINDAVTRQIAVGGYDGIFYATTGGIDKVGHSAAAAITYQYSTKAYTCDGDPFTTKRFQLIRSRWYVYDDTTITQGFVLDENESHTVSESFTHDHTSSTSSLYGTGVYGTARFQASYTEIFDLEQNTVNDTYGSRAKVAQITASITGSSSSYSALSALMLDQIEHTKKELTQY